MTVPSLKGVKINQVPINEVEPSEFVQKEIENKQREAALYDAIEPSDPYEIVWNSRVVDGVRQPVGSALTASAENTNYFYCHDHHDETAVCSTIYDELRPGDVLIVETPTETLTYKLVQSGIEWKGEVPSNEELKRAVAGRLVLFTCFSGGELSSQGGTLQNSVLIFELSSAAQK